MRSSVCTYKRFIILMIPINSYCPTISTSHYTIYNNNSRTILHYLHKVSLQPWKTRSDTVEAYVSSAGGVTNRKTEEHTSMHRTWGRWRYSWQVFCLFFSWVSFSRPVEFYLRLPCSFNLLCFGKTMNESDTTDERPREDEDLFHE